MYLIKSVMEENQEESLSQLFDKGLCLHSKVLDSNEETKSVVFQDSVKKGILILEDATRLVSLLDIFSRNENYSELPTDHLKFFLLPVLLGDLSNKLVEGERKEVVETVQIYYIDFLQRCQDYGFNIETIPKLVKFKADIEDEGVETVPRMPNMNKMNAERAAKMARYKQSKLLEADIKELKEVISGATRDEDVLREYYLKLIQKFVNTSLDELSSLEMEVGVLRHMEKVRAGKVEEEPERPQRKLQPIIITADKLQKEVYGLGYPSLPVLSVDEFNSIQFGKVQYQRIKSFGMNSITNVQNRRQKFGWVRQLSLYTKDLGDWGVDLWEWEEWRCLCMRMISPSMVSRSL